MLTYVIYKVRPRNSVINKGIFLARRSPRERIATRATFHHAFQKVTKESKYVPASKIRGGEPMLTKCRINQGQYARLEERAGLRYHHEIHATYLQIRHRGARSTVCDHITPTQITPNGGWCNQERKVIGDAKRLSGI